MLQIHSGPKPLLAFVYSLNSHLYLQVEGVADAPMMLPGSYVQTAADLHGIACRDFLHTGYSQIAVASAEGASAGSYLNMYSFDGVRLQPAIGGGSIGFYDLSFDCPRNRPCTVISYGKWTDPETSYVTVYQPAGGMYLQNDRDAEQYKEQRLAKLTREALATGPMAPRYRSLLASTVIRILGSTGRRAEARSIYMQAVGLLNQSSETAAAQEYLDKVFKEVSAASER